jgi:hypothetical protein
MGNVTIEPARLESVVEEMGGLEAVLVSHLHSVTVVARLWRSKSFVVKHSKARNAAELTPILPCGRDMYLR